MLRQDEKPQTQIDHLPGDIFNILSSYLPYNAALSNLRQANKLLNDKIELTEAGKEARKANDLKPGTISKWIMDNHIANEGDAVAFCVAVSMVAIGGVAGIAACVGYHQFNVFSESRSEAADKIRETLRKPTRFLTR